MKSTPLSVSLPEKDSYDILFIQDASVQHFDDIRRAKGVVARNGGYLSHLGILANELNKPFIISDEDYKEGELVFLDHVGRKVIKMNANMV